MHQDDAELFLQLPDGGRQRRLRDAASLGGAAEMPLPGQRHEEFELVDHREGDAASPASPCPLAGRPNIDRLSPE